MPSVICMHTLRADLCLICVIGYRYSVYEYNIFLRDRDVVSLHVPSIPASSLHAIFHNAAKRLKRNEPHMGAEDVR